MNETIIRIPPHPNPDQLPIEKPDIERWLLGMYGNRATVERDGDEWVCSWEVEDSKASDLNPEGFVNNPWGSV